MAHRHYHTQGFILNERPVREKDIIVSIFTPDLGLIHASVRSARDIRSKLRPHASRYSLVKVSLIRGREYWKVVGLETLDLMHPIWGQRDLAVPAARLYALLERLVGGEEAAPELYYDFAAILQLMGALPVEDRAKWAQNLECIAVLRILNRSGYLPRIPLIEPFIDPAEVDEALVRAISPIRLEAIKTINRAFDDANV